MKKIVATVFILSSSLALAQMTYFDPTHRIDDDRIYFFTQTMCPHCNHAATYIAKTYPDLKIDYLEITDTQNQESFIACANKFHLNKRKLGTPLICMGQHYILGWTEEEQKHFDEYVKNFIE